MDWILWPLILVILLLLILLLLFAMFGLMLRLVEFWAGELLPVEKNNKKRKYVNSVNKLNRVKFHFHKLTMEVMRKFRRERKLKIF